MGYNLTQKLFRSHLAHPAELKPGCEVDILIDQTLTHDINAVMCDLAFEQMGLDRVRSKCAVSYLDHNLLYIDNKTPDDHVFLQSFARKYGIYLSRPGNGICHSVHAARFAVPGQSLMGTDSHTPSSGALGMLALGAGGMETAMAMAGIPARLVMPKVVRVELRGRLRPGCGAKDVALEMLRRRGVKGGAGRIFEYTGSGAEMLEVPERMTIANMGAEMGAVTSVFSSDEMVRRFLAAQGREKDYVPLTGDPDGRYDETVVLELSELTPLAACPHMPDRVQLVSELQKEPIKVQQVFIGSCTNASYADIKKAAMVLKGRTVHPNVSLTVAVSTRQIFRQLMAEGVMTDLLDSGARIGEPACGACCGLGQTPPTNGVSVRTSNRNFRGRSGSEDARLYLVSPETAAATAVAGYLTSADSVMADLSPLGTVREPDQYYIDDSQILPPAPSASQSEIVWGPNIKPLPVNTPPGDTLRVPVSLKAGDNVSTDDITPASAQLSSMRSNIPMMAGYAFSRYDPGFAARAREMGKSIIVGGENYGQGSSREHAAIVPMYLGVKAVIAKSFSRIHRGNLINHGVIPMLFRDGSDYSRLEQGDELEILRLPEQLRSGTVGIRNRTRHTFFWTRLDLTAQEMEIILLGGKLNYIKQAQKVGQSDKMKEEIK